MTWMSIKKDCLRSQGKISLRYLPNFFINNDKDFIDLYDKFLHQIMEELYEFINEDIDSDNALEEIYDLLSYTGSLLIAIRYSWKVAYKYKQHTPPDFLKLYKVNNDIKTKLSIDDLVFQSLNILYSTRRLWIERKWHFIHNKGFNILRLVETERNLLDFYEALGELIIDYYGFERFNEVYIRKSNKNKNFIVQPNCIYDLYHNPNNFLDKNINLEKINKFFSNTKYPYRLNTLKEIKEL